PPRPPRARGGALRHPGRIRATRHRARRVRGHRARAVTPAARLLRERAECLHHRHQPRAVDQAAGRSALAVRALCINPRADLLWPFALGGFIAIASKYLLRYRGRHLWNPSNFAISLLLLAAPASVAILSRPWGNDLATNAEIWGFGLLIVSRVPMLHVTITYVASFVALAVLRHWIVGGPL